MTLPILKQGFGADLYRLRGRLSRAELARRMGISSSAIYHHEVGLNIPTIITYNKYIKALPALMKASRPNLSRATPRGPASQYSTKKDVSKMSTKDVLNKQHHKSLESVKPTASHVSTNLLRSLKMCSDIKNVEGLLRQAKADNLNLEGLLDVISIFTK